MPLLEYGLWMSIAEVVLPAGVYLLQMLTSEGVGEGVVGVRGKVVGGGGVGVVRVADDHQRRGRCWSRVGSRCWCGWEAWCRGMKGWLQMLVKVAGKVGPPPSLRSGAFGVLV